MEIIYKNPNDLIPSSYNPRKKTEEEFEDLKKSINEFGFVENVVINKENEIIGGHLRVSAAISLGINEVPCFVVDLPKHKQKLLNLALNKIKAEWDSEKLGILLTELGEFDDFDLSGFKDWEISLYNSDVDDNVSEKDFKDYLDDSKNIFLLKIFTTPDIAEKITSIIKKEKRENEDDGKALYR